MHSLYAKEVKLSVPRLNPNPFNINSIVDSKLNDVKKALVRSIKVKACLAGIKAPAIAKAMGVKTRTYYNRLNRPELFTLPELIGVFEVLKFKDEDLLKILRGKVVED